VYLGREEPNQTVWGGLGKSQHGFVLLGRLCGSGCLGGAWGEELLRNGLGKGL
jgi:hypothetical protein